MDGIKILDKRIRVEISRRGRGEARRGPGDSGGPSRGPPRRTDYRVKISGLPDSASWRELKDMLRDVADPAYVDTFGRGEGVAEFFSEKDVDRVVEKLDDKKFMGSYIRIRKENEGNAGRDEAADRDIGRGRDRDSDRDRGRDRDRERSRSRDRDDRGGRDRDREDRDDRGSRRRSRPEEDDEDV